MTLFPHTDAGDSAFDFFKEIVAFTPLRKVGNVINVSEHPAPEGLIPDHSDSSVRMEKAGCGML